MTTPTRVTSYKRAVALMTFTAFLVPLTGLISAPILARTLSPFGRGELAAAMAPTAVMLAFATIGLPDALTYYLAKAPNSLRRLLGSSSLITLALAAAFVGLTALTAAPLAAGRTSLAQLMVLCAIVSIPQLIWNVFRGAATGLQVWWPIVAERVTNAVLRIVLLLSFAGTGRLTVPSAMLISTVLPSASGLIYLALFRQSRRHVVDPRTTASGDAATVTIPVRSALGFGVQVWLGSVVEMLLSRTSQLLLSPLSNEKELGFFAVAVTVSDVVLIMVSAVQGTLFGVASRRFDIRQAHSTARTTLLMATIGGCLYAGAMPWLIPSLFGADYRGAILPSWLMVLAALIGIPGLIAGVALNALGRPIVRSAALGTALVVNATGLVLLAPTFGAVGAGLSAVFANLAMSSVLIGLVSRRTATSGLDFVRIRRSDLSTAVGYLESMVAGLRHGLLSRGRR